MAQDSPALQTLTLWGEEDSVFLGSGTLIAPSRLLTCSHVVGKRQSLGVRAGLQGELLSRATVLGQPGDPDSPYDLAVLKLEPFLGDLGWVRFAHGDLGSEFHTAGWTEVERHPVWGKLVGQSSFRSGWLEVEVPGTRKIVPGCSGSVVWMETTKRAAGLVAWSAEGGLAFVIPTGLIQEFWPDLPAPIPLRRGFSALSSSTEKLYNVSPDRFIRIADKATGAELGQGVRLNGNLTLTSAGIAESAESVSVVGRAEKKYSATQVDTERASQEGLCVLQSEDVERFEALDLYSGDLRTRMVWRSSLVGGESGERRHVGVGGHLGDRDPVTGLWSLELASSCGIEYRGAGVFVDPRGQDRWELAGVLTPVSERDGKLGWRLQNLGELGRRLAVRLAAAPARSRDPENLKKITQLLGRPGVAEAVWAARRIREEPPHDLERKRSALAGLLVDSEVNDLAQDLSGAYERTVHEQGEEAASALREIFEVAAPMAIRLQAAQGLPDRSAVDVRIDFFKEVLVELNLAAADRGPAAYLPRSQPGRSLGQAAVSPLQIEISGCYGPDLGFRGQAAEQLEALQKRLILQGAGGNSDLAKRFLAKMALSPSPGFGGEPIIGPEELEHLDRTARRDWDLQTRELLEMINEGVSTPTAVGRRLYLLLGLQEDLSALELEEQQGLAQVLRRLLPDLRVVKRGTDEPETARKFRRFSKSLQVLYGSSALKQPASD